MSSIKTAESASSTHSTTPSMRTLGRKSSLNLETEVPLVGGKGGWARTSEGKKTSRAKEAFATGQCVVRRSVKAPPGSSLASQSTPDDPPWGSRLDEPASDRAIYVSRSGLPAAKRPQSKRAWTREAKKAPVSPPVSTNGTQRSSRDSPYTQTSKKAAPESTRGPSKRARDTHRQPAIVEEAQQEFGDLTLEPADGDGSYPESQDVEDGNYSDESLSKEELAAMRARWEVIQGDGLVDFLAPDDADLEGRY